MLVRRSAEAVRCLHRADECEAAAESATDPAAKRSFLDVAERWRRIADTCEYIERVNLSLGKSRI
jgi:hypothetical protein